VGRVEDVRSRLSEDVRRLAVAHDVPGVSVAVHRGIAGGVLLDPDPPGVPASSPRVVSPRAS